MSGTIASTILSYVIVGSIGFYRALVVVHGTIGLVREGIRFSYRSVFIAYLSQFCAPYGTGFSRRMNRTHIRTVHTSILPLRT